MLAGILLLLSGAALASDLRKNASLLRSASDFRVRTQAALALGASENSDAVEPLCKGVSDEHRVVRIASATALARLDLGGRQCVELRLKSEPDAKVKAALQKALARLSGPEGLEPQLSAASRIYVSIGRLAGSDGLARDVRAGFLQGIARDGKVAVAPQNETPSEADALLKQHPRVKGFFLAVKAAPPVYAAGQLKVTLSVAIMSYPGRDLVGTFSQRLAMSGVTAKDEKAERELFAAAAQSAMRKFIELAPSLSP